MRTLKTYFFVGACTSGCVIFFYETLKPFDVEITGSSTLILLLSSYALFFTIIGALTSLFYFIIRNRIKYENKLEEQDKHRQRH